METRFEGRLTDTEFRRCHSLMQPRWMRAWWLFPSLALILAFVLRPYVFGAVRVGIALVALYLAFRLWGLRYLLRRTWKKNRHLHAPVKGTVSEWGIRWRLEGISSSEVAWSGFERYVETEDLILVYHAPNQALAVHRRYFASLAGWDAFRKFLSEKVPSTGKR